MAAAIRKVAFGLGNSSLFAFLPNKNVVKTQVAGLISKTLREKDYKRPPAFPYKDRNYGYITAFFDKTTWRFDENSKIIVIDGPFASGKAKLAKELSEEFDMHYIPHAHLDRLYVNSYGYDLRTKNDEIPPRLRIFDPHEFVANPKDERSTRLQHNFFLIRFGQYLDALGHILSTGQGVIMNRSVYSDFVFVETFIKSGFVAPTYKDFYYTLWNCLKPDLMRPHLIIYLDTPVEVVRENLKKRNKPHEINSPAYQPEVLKQLENFYKFHYLKEMSTHAELLVYDCSEPLETEIVVEDMERLNLENNDVNSKKMEDWKLPDEWSYNYKRIMFTSRRDKLETWTDGGIPNYYCKELMYDDDDIKKFNEAFLSLPGNKYQRGFNPDMGESVLFKSSALLPR